MSYEHEIEMQGGRGPRLISWTRIDSSGNSKLIDEEKLTMMHRCDLPARDLRLLDPSFAYPSTILARDMAIVVKLEKIRCIIMADVVFLVNIRDDDDRHSYLRELRLRLEAIGMDLISRSKGSNNNLETSPDDLPFEFRALEVALDVACSFLHSKAKKLKEEAKPLLKELTSKISTSKLEQVRQLKNRLVKLTKKVEMVKVEMEELMDDEEYMADMYLTEKKRNAAERESSDESNSLSAHGIGSPSPPPPPDQIKKLKKSWSISRKTRGSRRTTYNVEKLEMLLEAYFVVIDGTHNKLTKLNKYIDDTEDFINMQLDRVRNQLMQFELLVTTAAFVISIFGMVTGVFGMNFEAGIFENWSAFNLILIINGACSILIFGLLLWFLKSKKVIPIA